MTLAELIDRLGLAEVARRAGVSQATLLKWLRRGPSRAGLEVLHGIVSRHLRSKAASETRKKQKTFVEAPRRHPLRPARPTQSLTDPTSPELTDKEVIPKAAPSLARVRGIYADGVSIKDTHRYIGQVHTFTLGQPILELDIESLAGIAIETWKASDRTLCMVYFVLFRYIPFNPLYKGELIRKQGKWSDFWVSTQPFSDERSIRRAVHNELEKSIIAAERRVIWAEQMQVHVFDDKEDLPDIASIIGAQLR